MRFASLSAAAILLTTSSLGHAADDDLAGYDARIKPADRQHWAFQLVRPQAVPAVKETAWVCNPIDAFVLAKLEVRGWKPAPPAPPHALIRRLYLDLIGLPPTPEELDRQVQSSIHHPQSSLTGLVSNLLGRPQYGERWARYWLDLVRYADTNGYERDGDKPHVWRYRDYVIRALNNDRPYNRFLMEQLAGDELPDATAESVLATGFLRLGPWDDEPADPLTDRFDQLDDMVATTSQAFLGLTLACARCHNHKFEPLTLHDYYRMVAVFAPLTRPQNGRTELDAPAVPAERRQATEKTERALRLAGLGGRAVQLAPRGYILRELTSQPVATHLLIRGQATRPGAKVSPGVPAVLTAQQPEFLPSGNATSRRRLSLARWIASPDNPLTSRVIVNRVWQFHFGEGLVRTPSDFGKNGEAPTHPELLDYLAGWFVKEGWSLKKLHCLIVTSNAYQMSKRVNAEYLAADPDNRLLWRFPYRRLEAEVIRDSMLAVSGQLNLTQFGPSVFPPVPAEALEGHSDPQLVWKPSPPRDANRRTIYAHVKRSLVLPMIEVLDFCDTTRSTARRNVTTVAPQALTLYNGAFVNEQARHLASRLEREAGPDLGKQIDRAYRLALSRSPSTAERDALLAHAGLAATTAARDQLWRVLFNLNEFVYPD